jgi:hypothetical protein
MFGYSCTGAKSKKSATADAGIRVVGLVMLVGRTSSRHNTSSTASRTPRSDAFRPSDQVLGALDDLYELRASLEVKAGLPATPKPSAPSSDRKKAARVEA